MGLFNHSEMISIISRRWRWTTRKRVVGKTKMMRMNYIMPEIIFPDPVHVPILSLSPLTPPQTILFMSLLPTFPPVLLQLFNSCILLLLLCFCKVFFFLAHKINQGHKYGEKKKRNTMKKKEIKTKFNPGRLMFQCEINNKHHKFPSPFIDPLLIQVLSWKLPIWSVQCGRLIEHRKGGGLYSLSISLRIFDMQHPPAKLPFKLHIFSCVEFLAQSLCIGVTTEASWDFLHVNCRQLSKFFCSSTITKCAQGNLKHPSESQELTGLLHSCTCSVKKAHLKPQKKIPIPSPPHVNSNLTNYHSCTTFTQKPGCSTKIAPPLPPCLGKMMENDIIFLMKWNSTRVAHNLTACHPACFDMNFVLAVLTVSVRRIADLMIGVAYNTIITCMSTIAQLILGSFQSHSTHYSINFLTFSFSSGHVVLKQMNQMTPVLHWKCCVKRSKNVVPEILTFFSSLKQTHLLLSHKLTETNKKTHFLIANWGMYKCAEAEDNSPVGETPGKS
ncbi:hypothetical protein VP01_1765g3 [Puccinia sorghi]|uniref:Uncharacterized protein n=1 Tax=Puccinia sorghi TaxID=27349 RepID=A0A0L6VFF9_9BASI|nr:hypothetical protein VP01_1765g3 [Puccinia sorghi]